MTRYGKARGKRQKAIVKKLLAILLFFTHFGYLMSTYLAIANLWRFPRDKLAPNSPKTFLIFCQRP